MKRALVVACVAVMLLGCGKAVIDGSDAEHARVSIIKVRDSLPASKTKEFDDSLRLVMAKAADMPLLSNARVRAAIDGKTGEQIIATAAELRRAQDDAKLQADAAAIKATLNNIHATDQADADKLGKNTLAPPPPPASVQLALAAVTISETERKKTLNSADPEVKARCSQLAAGHGEIEVECIKREMHGKAAVSGLPPAGVGQEIGMRIRSNCIAKYPNSYWDREACENTDAGAILNISKHPEVMTQLTPQRQMELKMLMGTK